LVVVAVGPPEVDLTVSVAAVVLVLGRFQNGVVVIACDIVNSD